MTTLRKSLSWSFLDKYCGMGLGIISTLILSRLLTPVDIGIYSIAAGAVGLAHMLRDFGVATYLFQEKDLTQERMRAALGITLVFSWSVAAVMAALSSPIGTFYDATGVAEAILVLAFNFVLLPFGSIFMTQLRREMRFDLVFRINVASTLARTTLIIGLAVAGAGFMALAWGSLAGVATTCIAVRLANPRSTLLPSFKGWRRILSFSSQITLTQVLIEIGNAASDLVIGRNLGLAATGFWSRANGIVTIFNQLVLDALAPVGFAEVALRYRSGSNLKEPFLKTIGYITLFGWPCFLYLAVMMDPVVRILFGHQWGGAVPVARILCVSWLIYLPATLNWIVLQATNARRYLLYSAVTVPLGIAGLVVASFFSLEAIAVVGIPLVIFGAFYSFRLCSPITGIGFSDVIRAATKSLGIAVLTVQPAVAAVAVWGWEPSDPWIPVLLSSALGGSIFAGSVFLFRHPFRHEIFNVWEMSMRWIRPIAHGPSKEVKAGK